MRLKMVRRSASGAERTFVSVKPSILAKWAIQLSVRAAWPTLIAMIVLIALSSCGEGKDSVSPSQAFALSASALSGSDQYRLRGEITINDHRAGRTERLWYTGDVTGHGHLSLRWSDRPANADQTMGNGHNSLNNEISSNAKILHNTRYGKPLSLLNAMQNAAANVTYTDSNVGDGSVRLRIELSADAARKRIADSLQDELNRLRSDWRDQQLNSAQRQRGDDELQRASRQLAAILPTLQVQTICYWTADRKSWFPRSMREQTEIAYQWQGKTVRETRAADTYFLR